LSPVSRSALPPHLTVEYLEMTRGAIDFNRPGIPIVASLPSVLASRIEGKVGLLGADFEGCFPVGDAAALARLPERCHDEPAMLVGLRDRCARRAALFRPDRERAALLALVDELLETPR
jgi:hypothetical protein